MNQGVLLEGFVVSGVYLLFRFLEIRFILKENIPLKKLFRDTLLVYVSFIAGNFIYGQLGEVAVFKGAPNVFTDKPAF